MRKILAITLASLLCGAALANTCPILQAGATSQSVYVEFVDNTTGLPNASRAYNDSGIDLEYVRAGAAAVDITEATQTAAGAYSSGGFVTVGHGRYRLDIPDAAIAAGVSHVVVQGIITGYTMLPCVIGLSPAVNVTSMAADTVTASAIATDAIGAAEIAADAIGSSEIATGAIAAAEIAADAIGASEVAADVSTELLTGLANLAVNVAQISTDSTAADTLETWLDGTAGSAAPLGIVDQGTAQAATGTTVQLRSAAALADDTAIGMTVMACGSTQGYCQSRTVTDYVSSTDTATVDTWTVTPSGTITYYLFATAPGGGGSVSIAAGGITSSSFAAGAIDASAIAADAIGASEIATDAIGAAEIAASAIGASEIADGGITSTEFGTGAITATVIAADAIGASELADNAIDAGAIATDAITAAKIAADAIGASELATDAIGAAEVAADAIGASEIAADAIGASEIANNAIDAASTAADFSTEVQDADVESVNGVTINGDGSGTPFGP